jgi:hypothetical protein
MTPAVTIVRPATSPCAITSTDVFLLLFQVGEWARFVSCGLVGSSRTAIGFVQTSSGRYRSTTHKKPEVPSCKRARKNPPL